MNGFFVGRSVIWCNFMEYCLATDTFYLDTHYKKFVLRRYTIRNIYLKNAHV